MHDRRVLRRVSRDMTEEMKTLEEGVERSDAAGGARGGSIRRGASRGFVYVLVAVLIVGHPLALYAGGVLYLVCRYGDVNDVYTLAYALISLAAALYLSRLPQWRLFAWVCGALFGVAVLLAMLPRVVV